MYVTYMEYTRLGYATIPEEEFGRYESMAEQTVRRYTSDGISDNTITAANKRGVCEIADEYYMDKNPQIDNENKIVSSFNNAGYSETYVQRKQASADTIKTAEDTVYELIHTYFTAEQLYRGV